MSVEFDPQWADVRRMLEFVGTGPGGCTGTLYSDEARLILRAIGKPQALDRNKIAFLITDLCERHLSYDPDLGICSTGTVAFAAADQIIAWATGADNEAARLRAGIIETIAICEQDAKDQEHNAVFGWGRCRKAYTEGRGTACKGIATRLRALLPEVSRS